MSEDIGKIEDSIFESIRSLRRCRNLRIKNVSFANAEETLWNSQDVEMENVTANGKYFAMNTENVKATNITVCGDYCFDGAKDVEIHESRILSKDAFWNCENVTIYDSHGKTKPEMTKIIITDENRKDTE